MLPTWFLALLGAITGLMALGVVAALGLAVDAQHQLKVLRCELENQKTDYDSRIAELVIGIRKLTEQLRSNGITPCWTPNHEEQYTQNQHRPKRPF